MIGHDEFLVLLLLNDLLVDADLVVVHYPQIQQVLAVDEEGGEGVVILLDLIQDVELDHVIVLVLDRSRGVLSVRYHILLQAVLLDAYVNLRLLLLTQRQQ